MKIVAGILIAGLCCLQATAQELSSVVIPSEDEIHEAYITGEIDYDQYLLLMEMEQYGVDPSLLYLLDLIPELWTLDDSTEIDTDRIAVKASGKQANSRRLAMKYGYYRRLETPEQSRYQLTMRSQLDDHWDMAVRIRKELSGRERFTGRSARYRANSGLVRQAEIGTFTRKYGLGTVIGYRGKLLSYSGRLDDESTLFPDYGGFNGAAIDMRVNSAEIGSLVSYNRDADHSTATAAMQVGRQFGNWKPQVTMAATRIGERYSDRSVTDLKTALNVELHHSRGHAAVEYCLQTGEQDEAGTVVVDVLHRFRFAKLAATGWIYGDSYLNLSGGGKATAMSHRVQLEDIDFEFSDRRAGQTGFSVRASSDLTKKTRFALSALAAWRNADSSAVQSQSELSRKLGSRFRVGLGYLVKRIERSAVDSLYHRVRSTFQYSHRSLQIRSYLGQTIPESGRDYFSWLCDLHVKFSDDTKIQLWSNLARVINGRVDYWNIFAKLEQKIGTVLTLGTKFSDRYDPDASDHHLMAFSLEVSGAI